MGVGSWAQPSAPVPCWNLKVAVSLRSCMCLPCVQASEEETARERTPRSTVQAPRRTAMPTAWTQPPETSWKFFLLPLCKGGPGERPNHTPSGKKSKPNQRGPSNIRVSPPALPPSPPREPSVPRLSSAGLQRRGQQTTLTASSAAWQLLICLATVEKSLVAKLPPPPPKAAGDFAFEVVPNYNTVIGTKPALLRRDIFPPGEPQLGLPG